MLLRVCPLMRAECLPAEVVPHLTKLYRDYLAKSPQISKFYAPFHAASAPQFPKDRREAVAKVLAEQNRSWGASAKTLENIERLRNSSSAIVTGQQVALFGGPMFAVLKALTAIKHAEAATISGTDCVPIFWLASEDHDLAEVSSVTLLDEAGALRDFSASIRTQEGGPVGEAKFGQEIDSLVAEAAKTFTDADVSRLLANCYKSGETFAGAFAKLFTKLLADFGLILLDPSDAEFHKVAQPLLRSAAEQAADLNAALLVRGKELEAAGYHAQVKVTASSTVLFALQGGVRTAVHRVNGNFSIGKEKLSVKEMLEQIDARPQDFSGNALFRPVIQDYLLPTLAYVGGPAEVAYFAQSEVLYKKLLGRVTRILPRISATLVEGKSERLLKKYGLSIEQTFVPPDELQRKLAAKSLPGDIDAKFESSRAEVEKGMSQLSARLRALDPTLEEAAKRAGSKMLYQLSRLKGRAGSAEARKNADVVRHAALISSALFPRKDLQERSVAGISFVGRQGNGLLRQLYDALDLNCPGHQVLYL